MDKIRDYIEELFKDAPKTKRTRDLKEELTKDLEDKYSDLINDGKDEKHAYKEVISSIGDIDELIDVLKEDSKNNDLNTYYMLKSKKKTAKMVSLSIGLYILSLISVVVLSEIGLPDYVSASALLSIAGLATCLIVYNFMSIPKHHKYDETVVEDFVEWKSSKQKNKTIREGVSAILWTLIVIVYLLISFLFGIWYISWIIFIIGALVELIVDLAFKIKE